MTCSNESKYRLTAPNASGTSGQTTSSALPASQAQRATLLSLLPQSALILGRDVEGSDRRGSAVFVDGHVDEKRRGDATHRAVKHVLGVDGYLGLDAGAPRPGDACAQDDQVAHIDRVLEGHRVHDHGHHRPSGMADRAGAASRVGQFHQRAAVHIPARIRVAWQHHLRERDITLRVRRVHAGQMVKPLRRPGRCGLRLYERRLGSVYRDASTWELKSPYRYGNHTWNPLTGWMALFPAHLSHEVSVVRSDTALVLVFAMIRFLEPGAKDSRYG